MRGWTGRGRKRVGVQARRVISWGSVELELEYAGWLVGWWVKELLGYVVEGKQTMKEDWSSGEGVLPCG